MIIEKIIVDDAVGFLELGDLLLGKRCHEASSGFVIASRLKIDQFLAESDDIIPQKPGSVLGIAELFFVTRSNLIQFFIGCDAHYFIKKTVNSRINI